MTTDLYRRLLGLLPEQPVTTASITTAHADGTATVLMTGGASSARVRNPFGLTAGTPVYVQGSAVVGEAPSLTAVLIEI